MVLTYALFNIVLIILLSKLIYIRRCTKHLDLNKDMKIWTLNKYRKRAVNTRNIRRPLLPDIYQQKHKYRNKCRVAVEYTRTIINNLLSKILT